MNLSKRNIRPKLTLPKASTKVEQFQNETLRPILKLQHEILLQIFKAFAKKQKIDIFQLSKEKLINFAQKSTENNAVFRNQLIGIIIGQFTVEEFDVYTQNTSEFNKRTLQMIRKRIEDSYETLLKT